MSLHKVLSRFNLTRPPFLKDIEVDEFFVTDDLATARSRLKAAIEARSSATVTGESGGGKTYLTRWLREELSAGNTRVHYIHNSMVNPSEFYRQLSVELGLEPRKSAATLFQQVSSHLAQVATEHRARTVLVLDEAHLLPHSVLSHLHILLNFEQDSKPWLSLVLVGLPELRGRLARDLLKSLSSRLPTRIVLSSLDAPAVREYVTHRLAKVGAKNQIFSEDALLLLAEATRGVMRAVNEVATQSLVEALASKGTVVDATAVTRALETCKELLP